MTPIPGAHVITIEHPAKYTRLQIENAVRIAGQLRRGKFILTEPPRQ